MNKEKIVIIVLGFVSVLMFYAGLELGAKDKQHTHEIMTLLLESERDLETVQNIKALEGLRANKVDEIIKFMQVRVSGAVKTDGIKDTTKQKAKDYQLKYCNGECLGVNN